VVRTYALFDTCPVFQRDSGWIGERERGREGERERCREREKEERGREGENFGDTRCGDRWLSTKTRE
jgi:hypothetical protein